MSSAESAPGDTQLVSQSVYDGLIKQNQEAQHKIVHESMDCMDANAEVGTLRTLHEGEPGHIDLLAGFDHTAIPDTHPSDEHDENSSKIGESSPMQLQPDLFPESQRFVKKTPTMAVKQKNFNNMDMVTPASRTPLIPDTEPRTGVMALSQLFQSTQAPSSPLANVLHSDSMSDRPSPNVPVQNPSITANFLSPTVHRTQTLHRELSDPQGNYVSMKESQAERDRVIEERMTRSAGDIYMDNQSDDEFDKEPSFIGRYRRQKIIEQEAKAQLSRLSAPARSTSNHQDSRAPLNENGPDACLEEQNGLPQTGGISEEETEQEDEPEPEVLPSQEIVVSSEEDKENYNGFALPAPSGTTSAHDRLSQALGLTESPARSSEPTMGPTVFVQHSRNSSRGDQEELGSSSQVMVKDSQPTAAKEGDESQEARGLVDTRQVPNSSENRCTSPQAEPSSGIEKVASSPVRHSPTKSPPIPSEPRQDQILQSPQRNRSGTGYHLDSRSRSNSHVSSQPTRDAPTYDTAPSKFAGTSNEDNMGPVDVIDRSSGVESREKSSSMPSRIIETPIHPPATNLGEVAHTTTVPETSPRIYRRHNTTGHTQGEEDDGLLPSYPLSELPRSSKIRTGETHPQPRILSSPSGRQRRTLTDIAADASPQVGPSQFDMDINVFTAEDKEFSDLVGMSPAQPKKKRRGNNGKSVLASDPVAPVTPRSSSPRLGGVYGGRKPSAPGLADQDKSTVVPSSNHSRHPSPEHTVWDVTDSPHLGTSRPAYSRESEQSRTPVREPRQTLEEVEESRLSNANDTGNACQEQQSLYNDYAPNVSQATSVAAQIAPNQVLAPWNGPKRAYYPGTCCGRPIGTSHSRLLVRFENSAPVEIRTDAIKRLELQVGDAVKVDMPNVPKITHIIRGFDDKLSADTLSKGMVDDTVPMTDIYGHSTVLLGPKQRKSLPSGGFVGPENTIKVPISRIYLDTILWNHLKDRQYTASSEAAASESRSGFQTPSDRHPTPASPNTSLSRSTKYHEGIFTGMVFAVSYVESDESKTRITSLILENGGCILREGFNELFEFPYSVPLADTADTENDGTRESSGGFRLAPIAKELGFACVIADKHSRREKYMQALALNLPCLSGRWIEDCVRQSQILDWEMYLLPAGESMYLHGAIKSRILTPKPASAMRLSDTITARPKLLDGHSVLLVMGRGRAEEKRKAYVFLTYALGASKVERVYDLKTAKALLGRSSSSPAWDLIFVDDAERAAANDLLLGTGPDEASSAGVGKKRKRSGVTNTVGIGNGNGNGSVGSSRRPRIVGNEFVCQSLILGRLFED